MKGQVRIETFSARRPNIYTSFVAKVGALPDAKSADSIGRLLGTSVRAIDGKNYPQLSASEKAVARELADRKKSYHGAVRRKTSFLQALEALKSAGDPSDLAVHMKNDSGIGKALDPALQWLIRFAEEWRSHEQSRC